MHNDGASLTFSTYTYLELMQLARKSEMCRVHRTRSSMQRRPNNWLVDIVASQSNGFLGRCKHSTRHRLPKSEDTNGRSFLRGLPKQHAVPDIVAAIGLLGTRSNTSFLDSRKVRKCVCDVSTPSGHLVCYPTKIGRRFGHFTQYSLRLEVQVRRPRGIALSHLAFGSHVTRGPPHNTQPWNQPRT
jgi:hypothetical protein